MKKRILSIALALAMTASALPFSASAAMSNFSDVPDNAWYKSAVDYAVENELFSGNGDGTFSPNGDMTRAMFVTVLSKIANADVSAASDAGFDDVPNTWYTDCVNWAAGKGYVSGMGGNKFQPDSSITREQIAVILTNYMAKEDIFLNEDPNAAGAFNDWAKISEWAMGPVDYIRSLGLMSGDERGNFNPKADLTRAEASSVFMKFDQVLPKPHVHNWVKQPEGMTADWSYGDGPDENGYTTNRELARDKDGNGVGIYMCVRCYEYYGRDEDLMIERYWEHISQDGPCLGAGYCAYDVYAVYDLYYCEGCGAFKRGDFSFYGYYDYSDRDNPKWRYLTPEQIAELNLP